MLTQYLYNPSNKEWKNLLHRSIKPNGRVEIKELLAEGFPLNKILASAQAKGLVVVYEEVTPTLV